MAGQAAIVTTENPYSPVPCFAALLELPLSIALVQTMELPVPGQLGMDRVSGLLGRPAYGLLGMAACRIVDVLENENGKPRAAVGSAASARWSNAGSQWRCGRCDVVGRTAS